MTAEYLRHCRALVDVVEAQTPLIERTADLFAATILAGRMVHLFGSGHSRILVEEMWPRYGSFPGFNPIVELSLSFHNLVVGANGQRQAMFLENVPGLPDALFETVEDLNQLRSLTDKQILTIVGGIIPKLRVMAVRKVLAAVQTLRDEASAFESHGRSECALSERCARDPLRRRRCQVLMRR